jgi:hypothetical protein
MFVVHHEANLLGGVMPSSFVRKADRTKPRAVELTLAHSPDSDDAFMFYALATKKIGARDFSFTHRLEDIESLNRKALEGIYDITAISFHAYPYLEDKYVLLPSGASFGDRYGPVVVARAGLRFGTLKGKRVAVPGKMTTAYLALLLYEPGVDAVVTSFDQILDTVARGEADAGVVIHEGQLTYANTGLRKVLDLGEWWYQETKLPLPLGKRRPPGARQPHQARGSSIIEGEYSVFAASPRRGLVLRATVFARPGRHYCRPLCFHVRQRLDPRLRPAWPPGRPRVA